MMQHDHYQQYVPFKQRELRRQADNYRLARTALADRRMVRIRFYYAALARFGRWLVVNGTRLQGRYGQLPDLSQAHNHQMPYKPQV